MQELCKQNFNWHQKYNFDVYLQNHCKIITQPAFTISKWTRETLEQGLKYFQSRSSTFNVNFEHISHLVLVFLLLTLNM